MRALRLAPLLLALAACTVDTSSLKPKSDAECAAKDANTKSCGYKCVPVDDPKTGCAAVGDCSPCPVNVPNAVAACTAGACNVFCADGWSDCNGSGATAGDGCETHVDGNDSNHCGSCTRVCPSGTCAAGGCTGVALTTVSPVTPRGIQNIGGTIYFVDAGTLGTPAGAVWNADTGTRVISQIGSAATWLAAYGAGALVSGSVGDAGAPLGWDLALGRISALNGAGTLTPISVAYPASLSDTIAGLVTAGSAPQYAFFTAAEQNVVYYYDGSSTRTVAATPTEPQGLAVEASGNRVWFGSSASGGELRWVDLGTFSTGTLLAGTGHPSRLAVYDNPASPTFPNPIVFWISEDDGSVRAARADGGGSIATLVAPQGHAAVHADIAADANGVYWSNWWTGRLQMWRASDDRLLELGTSYAPYAVAVRGSTVYWTDNLDRAVYAVPVP
jgi:hypothetical protein